MSITQAYEQQLYVEVCDGEVVLRSEDGPFAVSLTAQAAALTARELAAAAERARAPQASQTDAVRD